MDIPITLAIPTAEVEEFSKLYAGENESRLARQTPNSFRRLPGREDFAEILGAKITPHLTPCGLFIHARVGTWTPALFLIPPKDIEDYLAQHYGYQPRPASVPAAATHPDADAGGRK